MVARRRSSAATQGQENSFLGRKSRLLVFPLPERKHRVSERPSAVKFNDGENTFSRRLDVQRVERSLQFEFKMWGANYDDISIEVSASRAPETMPCIVDILRTLATRIERGNLELPPITRFKMLLRTFLTIPFKGLSACIGRLGCTSCRRRLSFPKHRLLDEWLDSRQYSYCKFSKRCWNHRLFRCSRACTPAAFLHREIQAKGPQRE